MITPGHWTAAELVQDAGVAAAAFRNERLAISDAWEEEYQQARAKFDALFQQLDNLTPGGITEANLADAYRLGMGEALRYLAGPPISDDDLKVIAAVESLSAGTLRRDPAKVRKVFSVIERVIDSHRFPWFREGSAPTPEQLERALLASAVLLAAQRIATKRRNDGKDAQEKRVKDHLLTMGFKEVPAAPITTIVRGPQAMQFCAECRLGDRKADVVVRLHDTRLLAVECKVSNSQTNSIKRLNNDAAAKAEYWIRQFGVAQVVPAAALAGVFKTLNLEQAQQRGLALFWTHDLAKLEAFIEATRQ